ncbi:PAS domain S-box protein [Halobellus rarus]|uniref:PAS domain S-box protein n=1 Tax=Halobellus rarus TaxID=1126237 RepID=A0ABD6CIK7_9EURY
MFVTAPILLSLLLRILGVGLSVYLLYRERDRRFVFLVVLLSLMALRQGLTLFDVGSTIREVPAFLVSVLTVGLAFYLVQYVREESETKAQLREMNRELQASRNRLRAAMNASPEYIFLFDESGRYREVLSGEDGITIHPPEDLPGRTVEEVLPDETAAAVRAAVERTAETGEIQRTEYPMARDDGVEWYEARTACVQYPDEEVRHVLLTARDVTERKEREQKLRRFRRAIETAGHAIYITGDSGTITYVNPAFEEITGYSRDDAVGRTPELLNSGQMPDDYFTDLWATVQSGDVWEEEILNERRDGSLYYAQQTVAPVIDESGAVREFVAIQTDITPLKERERQLNVLSRVLRHNLRNDMNVILGKAQAIEESTEGEVASDAAQIGRVGERLLDLAETYREILDIIETSGSNHRIPLLDRVRNEVGELREAHPDAEIEVEFDCPEDVAVVAIPGVERAVGELLENAVIHSDREPPDVDLNIESTADDVRIRVADTGPGIPPTEWKILTGEHEINPLSHGTGLGLWLVHWLVTRADGHLSFEENEPRGSVVTIQLQRASEAEGESGSESGTRRDDES